MREQNVSLSFVSSAGSEQVAFAKREKVRVHSVEMSRQITPLRDLLSILRLVRLIRRARPAIVHAHTPKAGLVAMVSATVARVPVRIYQLHGLAYETATGFRRMVTGAGGSIGSELCRQIVKLEPASLVMFERYENSLHAIRLELEDAKTACGLHPVIGDVADTGCVSAVMQQHRPEIVFHGRPRQAGECSSLMGRPCRGAHRGLPGGSRIGRCQ